MRRRGRSLLAIGALLLLAVLGAGLWLRHLLVLSLPVLNGERTLPGLSAPVTVERDGLGVPTLKAATRLDAARALGFVHAQDRFFQMDLLRRESAGELAELLGPALVKHDEERRLHRFRHLAVQVRAAMSPAERALLDAYAAGVNSGLLALRGKPAEYLALRAEPRPWQPEDGLLAVYAMYLTLNDWHGRVETALGSLHERVPEPFFNFVEPLGSEWDAPLVGSPFPTPSIPGPEVFNLRRDGLRLAPLPRQEVARELLPGWLGEESGGEDVYGRAGSNNWAVAGSHTADGHALLANDMHLAIGVPNTWYRASWIWREASGAERRVTGVTLPGMPVLAVGSTGRIAWGFTNSFADVLDLVDLELDPHDPEVYRTPAGPRRFRQEIESIRIKGRPDERYEVLETIWGPVVERDGSGHPRRAVAWTADRPEATNLGLLGLETANNVDEAIEIAHASGLPPQNFTVADASGRVGWTIVGKLPRRLGWSGRIPSSWADGSHRWDGWLASAEVPKVVDPPSGRIWTANNRTVEGDMLARLGDGCYDVGARARQIRDRLLGLERATPRDLLAIALDDRALFLARWHDLLLGVLTPEATQADPRRRELRRLLVSTWTGRAAVDSVAYRVVREFRDTLSERVFTSLTGLRPEEGPPFYQARRRFEGPLWRLVTERPAHLLDPRFPSWDAALLAVVDEVIARLAKSGPVLAERTWGERNTLLVRHPLSLAVPALGRFLNVPPHPMPGDEDMPRVTGKTFGASERMIVSPGHEETGIFHMPVGESGHPLSPHYQDGHRAWQEGQPTPFLPGKPVDVLRLVPAA
ncbi:MAG TPA: penicillin acylase family protein [Thermoanaerobaculia bacterium]|nr:penicillin acylase family protein [Thermoanaerobaculia bacterium]